MALIKSIMSKSPAKLTCGASEEFSDGAFGDTEVFGNLSARPPFNPMESSHFAFTGSHCLQCLGDISLEQDIASGAPTVPCHWDPRFPEKRSQPAFVPVEVHRPIPNGLFHESQNPCLCGGKLSKCTESNIGKDSGYQIVSGRSGAGV